MPLVPFGLSYCNMQAHVCVRQAKKEVDGKSDTDCNTSHKIMTIDQETDRITACCTNDTILLCQVELRNTLVQPIISFTTL
jgi:hypothetical protein